MISNCYMSSLRRSTVDQRDLNVATVTNCMLLRSRVVLIRLSFVRSTLVV